MCQMLSRMGEENRRAVWAFMNHKTTLRMGTTCSGTDAPVLVLREFDKHCKPMLDQDFMGLVKSDFFLGAWEPGRHFVLEKLLNSLV